MTFPRKYCFCACTMLVAIFFCRNSKAQNTTTSFSPSAKISTFSIGVSGGWMRNEMSGSYITGCGCSGSLLNAKGNNGTWSFFINYELSKYITIGGNIGLDFKSISSSSTFIDSGTYVITNKDSVLFGIVPYQNNSSATAKYFYFAPYIKINPLGYGLFIKVSPEFGILTNSNYTDIRTVNDNTLRLINSNGRDTFTVNNYVFQNGKNSETLQDGPIDGVNKLRVAVFLSVGYDIPIFGSFSLVPEAAYNLALTNISNSAQATDWKISSYMLTLGIKYEL